jgi:hypothetical protein
VVKQNKERSVEDNAFLNMVRRVGRRNRGLKPAAERHKGQARRLAAANSKAVGLKLAAEPRTEGRPLLRDRM